MARRRVGLICVVMVLSISACRVTGSAVSTSHSSATATPSAAPSGPSAFSPTAFDRPFTITLPAGWVVGDQAPDMSSLYLPGVGQAPGLAIDVQEVSNVFTDPCDPKSATIKPGTSAADLATWMGRWAPLHATAPTAAKVSGLDAIMVEEGFGGTPCATANLWPTSGGYLDPQEHKRYFILEVGGKRVVVTLVAPDDTWATTLTDGLAVLDTLKFTTE